MKFREFVTWVIEWVQRKAIIQNSVARHPTRSQCQPSAQDRSFALRVPDGISTDLLTTFNHHAIHGPGLTNIEGMSPYKPQKIQICISAVFKCRLLQHPFQPPLGQEFDPPYQ